MGVLYCLVGGLGSGDLRLELFELPGEVRVLRALGRELLGLLLEACLVLGLLGLELGLLQRSGLGGEGRGTRLVSNASPAGGSAAAWRV